MRLLDLAEVPDDTQETFLLGCPEAMLYHSPKYRRLLVELLECRPLGAAVLDGDELVGIAAVMESDGPQGRILNSLPFYGSHGGLLARTDAARRTLAEWYRDLVAGDGIAAATMVENPLAPGSSVDGVAGDYADERIGQLTPLTVDKAEPDALMASLHSKTRNMVRKGESSGVAVGTDARQLQVLAQIHGENMRAMSASPKPDRFFELVPRVFEEGREWQCWVGRKDGEVIAALLVFHFNGTTEYFTPAVREEHRSSQALSLVVFEAMRDAARRGMRWWNWGGTWRSQESVYRFKSRWGTVDMPYRYRTVVRNRELLSLSPAELLADYPYFYVVPFGALGA
jgi:hypothetical protein